MTQRVELCTNCKEITTQKQNKDKSWRCEKCRKIISSDTATTVLGNFINRDLKEELLKKFA